MGWGRQNVQASQVGAGPYAANYNRNFDTHTEKGSNQAFAVNPPAYSDVGPYEYSGIGTDKQDRAYHNPTNCAPDQAQHGSPYGYLGDTRGPREIQTGNAPSGGYYTQYGLSWGFQQNAVPDDRRMGVYRPSDWEHDQVRFHADRDAELKYRRSLNVDENWTTFQYAPTAGEAGSTAVNAIEDSPYRKDWPDGHAANGRVGGSATYKTNPNRFRNTDVYDSPGWFGKTSGTRFMNGTHYSMAVHPTMTPYEPSTVGGTPVRNLRNTFSMTPAPWDTTNTDSPNNTSGYPTNVSATGGAGSSAYGNSYRIS